MPPGRLRTAKGSAAVRKTRGERMQAMGAEVSLL